MSEHDNVNHPAHYEGNGMEAIDVAEAFLTPEELRGAMKFNAMKYILRAGKKDISPGSEDCKKAVWYTNRLAKYFENEEKKYVTAPPAP